jgi:peptidoglycan/LPS O-acetylase OafA/YrhL
MAWTISERLNQHTPALDGIRGLAVLSVFVHHYGGGSASVYLPIRLIGNIVKSGWLGVSLFFVLSGFLISGILWDSFGQPHWWRNFYARRALRIFPLYYLAILLTLILSMAATRSFTFPEGVGVLALYLQNFPPLFPALRAIPAAVQTSHFWSLGVEEQFYLFWPFILMAVGRRSTAKGACIVVFVTSVLFRIVAYRWFPSGSAWAYSCLLGRMGELSAGAYLALAIRGEERATILKYAAPTATVTLIVLVLTLSLSSTRTADNLPVLVFGMSTAAILFASLIAIVLRPGPLQRVFEIRPLRWVGKISYGIYVYHVLFGPAYKVITSQIIHSAGNAFLICRFFVAAILTLAISAISFYGFERPIQRFKSRFPMKQATVEPAASPISVAQQ